MFHVDPVVLEARLRRCVGCWRSRGLLALAGGVAIDVGQVEVLCVELDVVSEKDSEGTVGA